MTEHLNSPFGVIFDWDGVIIDSSAQHEESWERLATEERRTLPVGHFKLSFGMKNERIIPELLRWADEPGAIRRLSLRKEALYREIVKERGMTALPGVTEFLLRLRAAGVPFAVGSSTHRQNIEEILQVLGFTGFFRAIVTSEDVSHGKPHPEVFLAAAQRLQYPATKCVVFEDAFVGIEAARAGKMKVIAVATTHPAEELRAKADRVVHRLHEVTIADIAALVG